MIKSIIIEIFKINYLTPKELSIIFFQSFLFLTSLFLFTESCQFILETLFSH